MRQLARCGALAAALLVLSSPSAHAALQDLLGRYGSQTTRGIAMVKLRIVGDQVMMGVWGRCSPQNCYWGEQPLQLFGANVGTPIEAGAVAGIAQFTTPATQTMVVVRKSVGGSLLYQAFTNFTDNSGRASYMDADKLDPCASPTCAAAR
jgi:hypothetical protein